jgi:hypothetical protein
MAQKAYQMIKQGPFESFAQYREGFQETYHSFKNMSMATNPIDIDEKEQAMDFFHGCQRSRTNICRAARPAALSIQCNWTFITALADSSEEKLFEEHSDTIHLLFSDRC